MSLVAATQKYNIEKASIEEFIFERYFGFTKLANDKTQEYQISHPKWCTNKILTAQINCDFDSMYGKSFAFLNQQNPDSIVLAEGSSVSVNWDRNVY